MHGIDPWSTIISDLAKIRKPEWQRRVNENRTGAIHLVRPKNWFSGRRPEDGDDGDHSQHFELN
jgi:hypothetical protein